MPNRIIAVILGIFFLAPSGQAARVLETEAWNFSLEPYLRTDVVGFNNVVDLDSRLKDDSTLYLGLDYSLGFRLESRDENKRLYLKLERNGPYDYDAPLFVHNTLMSQGGVIEGYRDDEWLPQVEEFWLDLPLAGSSRFKLGLYAYAVGNGFSLSGAYENYGLSVFSCGEDFSWSLYYCKPDASHKTHLGPRVRQEEEQGILYESNAANFFAADLSFKKGESVFEPYIGFLADYTAPEKRDNRFATPVERDILGTLGIAWTLKRSDFSWTIETARNFGAAKSGSPSYKDVRHEGFFVFTKLDGQISRFSPMFALLAASGNKVTPEMAENQDEVLTSGKNRAFSNYSPLNKNLGDSISSSNVDMLPIVAMGGGYGLNYGIPRPGTFSVADFENLIIPSLGVDVKVTQDLTLGLYGYYLSAFKRPVGVLNGTGRYLSRALGSEIDAFLDYQLNKNVLISLLGGYFFPGKYYRESRDDAEGSLFNPLVRGDGSADGAYQIECAVELKF